jgi:hypothetical protein
MHLHPLLCGIFLAVLVTPAVAQEQQRSPLVEHTRSHPRLKAETPPGARFKLRTGTLFLPEKVKRADGLPLFVHFHGGTWLPEVAAARVGAAVVTVQLGAGSSAYARPFADPKAFAGLLREAETKAGVRFGTVGLTAWSAGYGAVRAILRVPENYRRVQFVLLLDALHAGYEMGPHPREGLGPEPADLDVFVHFAHDATAEGKQLIVTHTEVFPGTFASTTETADHLLGRLRLKRKAVLAWGPMGTQQLSEVQKGHFRLAGYAGNTAPDHVDQLHALPDFLRWVKWEKLEADKRFTAESAESAEKKTEMQKNRRGNRGLTFLPLVFVFSLRSLRSLR